MIPNFVIAGAPKSGTTSLYRYCAEHPDVYMSPVKEPNFFSSNPHGYTARAYEDLFSRWEGQRAVGEASPSYLYEPGAAEAIAAAVPSCRIVIILRNPVDRLVSDYHYSRSWGSNLDTNLSEFVDACLVRNGASKPGFSPAMLVEKGRYLAQIRRFRAAFPSDHIFLRLYDDLRNDPARLMTELYTFLGVDPSFRPDVEQKHNVYAEPVFPMLSRVMARARRIEDRVLSPFLPSTMNGKVTKTILALNRRRSSAGNGQSEHLSAADRARLVGLYQDEVEGLGEEIGRELNHWLRWEN